MDLNALTPTWGLSTQALMVLCGLSVFAEDNYTQKDTYKHKKISTPSHSVHPITSSHFCCISTNRCMAFCCESSDFALENKDEWELIHFTCSVLCESRKKQIKGWSKKRAVQPCTFHSTSCFSSISLVCIF